MRPFWKKSLVLSAQLNIEDVRAELLKTFYWFPFDRWSKLKDGPSILIHYFFFVFNALPYERHYNLLLIRNCSWILTIHKTKIIRKKPLEKTFFNFKKWVKSIQTAGYNGARTVCIYCIVSHGWQIFRNNFQILNLKQFLLPTDLCGTKKPILFSYFLKFMFSNLNLHKAIVL